MKTGRTIIEGTTLNDKEKTEIERRDKKRTGIEDVEGRREKENKGRWRNDRNKGEW